jgi:hypothetical protein
MHRREPFIPFAPALDEADHNLPSPLSHIAPEGDLAAVALADHGSLEPGGRELSGEI